MCLDPNRWKPSDHGENLVIIMSRLNKFEKKK